MPKSISLATKREWLEQFEKGISETQISAKAKRDIRTVKKGLEDARRERVSSQARAELVKDAMRDHNRQLINTIATLPSLLELPSFTQAIPWEKQFTGGSIRIEGITARYESLVPPHTISITLDVEDKQEWELLREHLKKDPFWLALNQWKKALTTHLEALIRLKLLLAGKLRDATGYKFAKDVSSGSCLYPFSVDLIFRQMLIKLPRFNVLEEFEGNIRLDQGKGEVRYATSTILAHAPGKEEECRTHILEAVGQVIESKEAKEVASTYATVDESTAKVKRAISEVLMMGLVPGQCRICSRLGI